MLVSSVVVMLVSYSSSDVGMQLFVSVSLFPLEAFALHIKHCQYSIVVRRGYIITLVRSVYMSNFDQIMS